MNAASWSDLYQTGSKIYTRSWYNDSSHGWACKYQHKDSDPTTSRTWLVEIGVHSNRISATVTCRVSYNYNHNDLATQRELPQPSAPAIIHDILQRKHGLVAYSQNEQFRLRQTHKVIKTGEGKALSETIFDKQRRHTVFLLNPNSQDNIREARSIERLIAGKAQIYVLDEDPSLVQELRAYIDDEFLVGRGKMRVYLPVRVGNPNPKRHRWYDLSAPDYEQTKEVLIRNLLSNYRLEEQDAIANIEDIYRRIERSKMEKTLADYVSNNSDLTFMQEYITKQEEEFEHKLIDLRQQADYFTDEYESSQETVRALEARIQVLKHRILHANHSNVAVELLRNKVSSLSEILDVFARLYPTRLVFTKHAHASASQYTSFIPLHKAWDMMHDIATKLWGIKFESTNTLDLARRFNEVSQFTYAKTEGKQSKGDIKITQSRTIHHEGRHYEIWKHIKYGNQPPKCLRIHFDFDETNQHIIIGYVGPHMPNALSKKRR